jgi:hypothetical protein
MESERMLKEITVYWEHKKITHGTRWKMSTTRQGTDFDKALWEGDHHMGRVGKS